MFYSSLLPLPLSISLQPLLDARTVGGLRKGFRGKVVERNFPWASRTQLAGDGTPWLEENDQHGRSSCCSCLLLEMVQGETCQEEVCWVFEEGKRLISPNCRVEDSSISKERGRPVIVRDIRRKVRVVRKIIIICLWKVDFNVRIYGGGQGWSRAGRFFETLYDVNIGWRLWMVNFYCWRIPSFKSYSRKILSFSISTLPVYVALF